MKNDRDYRMECLSLASLVLNGTPDDGRVVKLAREYYEFVWGIVKDELREKS